MSNRKTDRSVKLRKEYQERLAEYLSQNNNIRQVIDSVEKLEDLETDLTQVEVTRIDKSITHRMKMMDYYLPKPKAIEVTGELDLNQTIGLMTTEELKKRAVELLGGA